MMIIIASAVPRLLVTDKDPAVLINMQNQPKKIVPCPCCLKFKC